MTTIHLTKPTPEQPIIQVFGAYEGDDDRFVFGVERFTPKEHQKARAYAARLARQHRAERTEGF